MTNDYLLTDITRTYYDFGKPSVQEQFFQNNLRKRVAWAEVIEKNATDTIATYYSYDVR